MTLKDHIRRKINAYIIDTGLNPTKLILGLKDYRFLLDEIKQQGHLCCTAVQGKDSYFYGMKLTISKRKRYVCVLGKRHLRKKVFQREFMASLWKYEDDSFFKSVINK